MRLLEAYAQKEWLARRFILSSQRTQLCDAFVTNRTIDKRRIGSIDTFSDQFQDFSWVIGTGSCGRSDSAAAIVIRDRPGQDVIDQAAVDG